MNLAELNSFTIVVFVFDITIFFGCNMKEEGVRRLHGNEL